MVSSVDPYSLNFRPPDWQGGAKYSSCIHDYYSCLGFRVFSVTKIILMIQCLKIIMYLTFSGAVGYMGTSAFVRKIYTNVKID